MMPPNITPPPSLPSSAPNFEPKGIGRVSNTPANKPKEVSKPQDNSIFSGKSEVSRMDLRQKLRKDPKIWQAERAVGLTLSPAERVKLEKEVFSPALGRNISKSDLNWGIKKLNQKLIGTKNPEEHAKIRKEIQFFKKIGGIQ